MNNEIKKQDLAGKLATKYDMDYDVFMDTIKKTIMPGGASNEELVTFLAVANEYDLNPFIKQIYAFSSNKGIHPIVPVDGWTKIVNGNPNYDGMEFDDTFGEDGKIASISCTIFRKDRNKPTMVTEYYSECFRETGPWKKWPVRMLRHKAFIQCARYAFGLSGIFDPDEAARIQDAEQGTSVEEKTALKMEKMEKLVETSKEKRKEIEKPADVVEISDAEKPEPVKKEVKRPVTKPKAVKKEVTAESVTELAREFCEYVGKGEEYIPAFLESVSAFTMKDGKNIPGKEFAKDLSPARLKVVYGKVKTMLKDAKEDVIDDENIAPAEENPPAEWVKQQDSTEQDSTDEPPF